MVWQKIARKIERLLNCGILVFLAFGVIACSNSTPEVRQNSPAPNLASNGLTISDLDASAVLTGSCDEIGKLDKGFEIQLDGSLWISKPAATCRNGRFEIRVERLGHEMQFQNRVRATKQALVRRHSITGKVGEAIIPVRYIPETVSGGIAVGGGVTKAPSYVIRGSFQNVTKESGTVATSTDSKYKMILSRDKDRL